MNTQKSKDENNKFCSHNSSIKVTVRIVLLFYFFSSFVLLFPIFFTFHSFSVFPYSFSKTKQLCSFHSFLFLCS